MTSPLLDGIPDWAWSHACEAEHRLLMCDFDGTLAPLSLSPAEASADARSLGLLREIADRRRTTVAIVSGRPIHELVPRLDPLRAWLVGEHGWEIRFPDGEIILYPLEASFRHALTRAAEEAQAKGWGSRLEGRRTALVLHTRDLPPNEARAAEGWCASSWVRWSSTLGMRLVASNGGIELRAAGHDKGTAVLDLLGMSAPGAYPVYLGDDESDEDAFSMLGGRGLGILVGRRRKRTLAQGRIGSWEGVAPFLEAWLARVEVDGRDARGTA